jgi:L-2-hydroxyglutarate oxidase LhgO
MNKIYDYLIVGAGIVGLAVAYELKRREPCLSVAVVEKESNVAEHASGRNSGVLHAGFYYSPDSLKAKLTAKGNRLMKNFCKSNGIPVKETQKVVVATNEKEVEILYELERRGKKNGINVKIIDEKELHEIEPNAKTFAKALYSPSTASVNPKLVCLKLRELLSAKGVDFCFNTNFLESKLVFKYKYLINAAGSYADKIAKIFGVGMDYVLLPFKGLYLKYIPEDKESNVRTNIYPVPNLANPFLGIHFTITSEGTIKIGPTATPAFWRENYEGFKKFNLKEFLEILFYDTKLFILNSFNFRKLAFEEIKYYRKANLIRKARELVRSLKGKFIPLPAGIRAQLLNRRTNELVQDFVIEHGKNSTHILNAVSPAFTCSFAFAELVVDEILKRIGGM